jgi:uncharacterized protein (DUF4415 family)
MKHKTRVARGRKVASLRASEGVQHERPTSDRQRRRGSGERRTELQRWRKLPKKRVTLNLDADVLVWFRELGRGYQWEINRVLRKVMEEEKNVPGPASL